MAKGLIFGALGLALVVWGAYDLRPHLKGRRFRRQEGAAPARAPEPLPPGGPPWGPAEAPWEAPRGGRRR